MTMNVTNLQQGAIAVALAVALGGCASWHRMDEPEKGTTVGAAGGAVTGAIVGGPVGAVVGAGVGAYAGNYAGKTDAAKGSPVGSPVASTDVSMAQQALVDRGYSVGAVDGQWGPGTESALRKFQQENGLTQSGTLDAPTRSALGIAR
jgi:phage tail tape-measure protein